MDSLSISDEAPSRHVVAIPYPGRGHINPMMNLCKLLVTRCPNLTITFVVTEEWVGLLGSTPKPSSILLRSIPNVIPSESIRASVYSEFLKAVGTNMEAPVEQLLDSLLLPSVSAIIADTVLPWAVAIGNRKEIPVVSLWILPPTVFSQLYYFHLLSDNGHFPVDLSERGDEVIDYIPGISPTRLSDFFPIFSGAGSSQILDGVFEAFSWIKRAQSIIFTSFYELEPQVFDNLKASIPCPIYSVGPLIPHTTLDDSVNDYYFKWLNNQPTKSVLYVSLGSFLSVSRDEMEEIIHGIHESGVRCLWVARGDSGLRVQQVCGDMVLVVPWCDQLKVLCHPSVGGFWTHCGWNSTLEGVFAGVPMLTFPIAFDQIPNQKSIVDDWKVGMRVKEATVTDRENVTGRKEISMIVRRFMGFDDGGEETKEMRQKSIQLKETCRQALMPKGGSSEANLDAFVREFLN